MVFTILSRVQVEGGVPVAIAIALPMHVGVLAEVRTHTCTSQEEAVARLDSIAQCLRLEVIERGDSVLLG
jgi:hypothetical protein